ncbi:MAG: T9SS type A sorting domain-containing protein, partial [Bacteroidota bacterium]
DTALTEVSGLIHDGIRLLAHRDEIVTQLYQLDTLSGNITQTYACGNVSNYNCEEIAQDSLYIYIGDFGNNINGNRTDLRIFRVSKSDLLLGNAMADTIHFSYATQTNFTATGINNTDFDCEAFIVTSDSIFLFTKRWVSGGTAVYGMPKSPGQYSAVPLDSFNTQGYITGATHLPEKQLIVLCGYNSFLQPFLYLLYDYTGSDFFSANKRRIPVNLPFHQLEGIATADGLRYYVANEAFSSSFTNVAQQLHTLNLDAYLDHYLNPISTGLPDVPEAWFNVFPNPTSYMLCIKHVGLTTHTDYQIMDSRGNLVQSGTFNSCIPVNELTSGLYFLRFATGQTRRFVVE